MAKEAIDKAEVASNEEKQNNLNDLIDKMEEEDVPKLDELLPMEPNLKKAVSG